MIKFDMISFSFKFLFICLIFGFVFTGCNTEDHMNPVEYVNPFIGTGATGHNLPTGNTFPGATRPFGMVQLSPDNGAMGEKNYYYGKKSIVGFSHTHLSGTGPGTWIKYANILFMPTVGPLQTDPGQEGSPDVGYRSRYSHDREEASPGYYKVILDDYDVEVELTASQRAGMHRYKFPSTDEGHIVIDITPYPTNGQRGPANIKVIGDNQLAGSTTIFEREGNIPFTWYFYAEFNKPFDSFGTFHSGETFDMQRSAEGTEDVGAFLNYQTGKDESLIVRVGISFTSIEAAKRNLHAEIKGWDFDSLRTAAKDEWNNKLRKVNVDGGTRINKEKFYTALYHSMLFPRTFSDVDGSYYSHFQDTIYKTQDFTYHIDLSLWDTYRAVHPLFTILEPERQTDVIKTLLAMYEQGGRIPLQTSYRNFYSDVMIGDHGSALILDSYLKGLRDYDLEKAYAGMRKNAFAPGEEDKYSREGLESYQELGYVAADRVRESVSLTLEDAYVDWGLAQVAKELGRLEDYKVLMKRSQNYRNVYDTTSGFFRPRMADGSWLQKCRRNQTPQIVNNGFNSYYNCWDPWWIGVSPNRHYTESNAYQYLWYVPHDIPGLMELMGGPDSFVDRLDELFSLPSSNSGPMYPGVTGTIGQYVHGNEPSHHVAYLYNYGGTPWKTQKRVREIMETKYGIDSRGLCGNDDMGQMSAWFVFGAMGFYPVTPGSSVYQIGSPLFDKIEVNLGEYYADKTFTVIANNVSGDNKYIQSARLNGQPLKRPWITHEEIVNGGRLEFEMGPSPNKSFWNSSLKENPIANIKIK